MKNKRTRITPPNYVLALRCAAIVMALVCGQDCPVAVADESPQAVREHIKSLSDAEKRVLQHRRERFERLSPDAQQRMKQLHEQVESSPDADRLVRAMERYHEWLKALTPNQRKEIFELPPDERLKRISEVKRKSESSQLRRIAGAQVTEDDISKIHDWLKKFAMEHEEEIKKIVPDAEINDRTRMYVFARAVRRTRGKFPTLTEVQRDELVTQLSDGAQAEFKAKPSDDDKIKLIRHWTFIALMSRTFDPKSASKEELLAFYNDELSDAQREILSRNTGDRFHRELQRLYWFSKTGDIRDAFGGPGRFGPRRGRRGGPGPNGNRRDGERDGGRDERFRGERRERPDHDGVGEEGGRRPGEGPPDFLPHDRPPNDRPPNEPSPNEPSPPDR